MTDDEAKRLIAKYERSHFFRETTGRPVQGSTVPIQRGDALVRSMLENVEQSKRDIEGTRQRAQEAAYDGLFDADAIDTVRDKKLRQALLEVAKGVIGDYRRAQSELNHWREYASWAMSPRVTTLRESTGAGGLIRGLAESRSGDLPSPASVPITDAELNEGRRRIEAQIAEWRARNGETPLEQDRRLPPEREPGDDDLQEAGVPF